MIYATLSYLTVALDELLHTDIVHIGALGSDGPLALNVSGRRECPAAPHGTLILDRGHGREAT